MFDQLMKKKPTKDMDPVQKKAKMSAISDLRNLAAEMMKGDLGKHLDGMKSVSVQADDKDGLKDGLDKAKEMLGEAGEEDASDESHDEEGTNGDEASDEHAESDESPEEVEEDVENTDMSLEEIEEMQRILDEKKAKLLAK